MRKSTENKIKNINDLVARGTPLNDAIKATRLSKNTYYKHAKNYKTIVHDISPKPVKKAATTGKLVLAFGNVEDLKKLLGEML